MRLPLIFSVLALTALIFYATIQSFPATDSTTPSENVLTQIEADRAVFDQQTATLNQTIAELRTENLEQAAAFEAGAEERDQLRSQLSETSDELSILQAESITLEADNSDLAQELAILTASLESSEIASRDTEARFQSLNDLIEQGREDAQALQARIVELESENVEISAQLVELESNAAAPSTATAVQRAQAEALSEQDAIDLAAAEERIARLTEIATVQVQTASDLNEEIESLEVQVATLTTEASNLSDEVAKRNEVIAGLMARTETANTPPVAGCQERTNPALAVTQISFETGTATIDASSYPLLEELAAIASDCVQKDLTLEIEGHTGNSGRVASNLLLSDGRAKSRPGFLD
jgi:outer membrane protein OmpA-like peptidoglycan-associated protein